MSLGNSWNSFDYIIFSSFFFDVNQMAVHTKTCETHWNSNKSKQTFLKSFNIKPEQIIHKINTMIWNINIFIKNSKSFYVYL